jgi:hypothetical protein
MIAGIFIRALYIQNFNIFLREDVQMKKIATHFLALALLACGVLFTSAVVNAAPVTPTGGTGTQADPFVISLADYGDYEHASTASTDTAYYSVTFAKDGIVTFKGGSIYQGSGSQGVDSNTPVVAGTPMVIRNAGSRSLSISYNGASTYTTKDSAYDLSAVTAAQAVSIPQGAKPERETWFKFTITAPSTIEFEPYVTTGYTDSSRLMEPHRHYPPRTSLTLMILAR